MAIFNKTTDNKKTVPAVKTKEPKAAGKKSMAELYEAGGKAKKEGKTAVKAPKSGTLAYRVLLKPIVTEKASILASKNQYAFSVATGTNKIDVAKAVLEAYGVAPAGVNMISMRGKLVRTKRVKGKRKDWKKAIVTLPKGTSIDIYAGV
jgi:large subunit ribosomal protein L23